jgi:hypothetical protein
MIDPVIGFLAQGFFDFKLVYDDSAGYDDWKVSEWHDGTYPGLSDGLTGTLKNKSFGSILASFK